MRMLKPKTGDRIAAISRLVPGAGEFSNSLFANLYEFRASKESLQREGIFDETWETLVIPRRGADCHNKVAKVKLKLRMIMA